MATTAAPVMDSDTNAARHAGLARQALLPDEELVDTTYASVDHILKAAADHGVTLTGPLPRRSGPHPRCLRSRRFHH
ncbi:hypothetical protein [Streptomyces sp. YIM 121038]|uniref:hypothetical protein n=1 Tax=Streptomyces sp. YIM 121038 TaxID=2136401 RepID=UPI001110DB9A|nr:hypothetical protein [Streptomyces sp. YIM 121038]